MEKPSEIRAKYVRSPETYSMADLCQYANEILYRYNDDKSAADTAPRFSWPTAQGEIHLNAERFDQPRPIYRLMFIDEQAIGTRFTYVFSRSANATSLYDTNHKLVNATTPFENDIALMAHLRSNPYIKEPQNNREATMAFDRAMANLAIDAARQEGLIDIPALALSDYSLFQIANLYHAQQDALASHVSLFDQKFFFTQSEDNIAEALDDQIQTYRKSLPALPIGQSDIPPA